MLYEAGSVCEGRWPELGGVTGEALQGRGVTEATKMMCSVSWTPALL